MDDTEKQLSEASRYCGGNDCSQTKRKKKKTIQEMSTVLEASGTTSHILAFAL